MTTCHHVFILPPPNGPTAEARCRDCGEVRTCYNSDPEKAKSWKAIELRKHANAKGRETRAP